MLIYGDRAYGEPRDLFTGAANDLQGMFDPPAPSIPSRASFAQPAAGDSNSMALNETTLPSSPPARTESSPNYDTDGDSNEELPARGHPTHPRGRPMTYKLNDEDDADLSPNSDMLSPPRSVRDRSSQLSPLTKPSDAPDDRPRVVSNQSAAQHEILSPILIAKKSSDDGKIDFVPVGVSASELQQRLEKLWGDQTLSGSEESGSRTAGKPNHTEATGSFKQLGSFVNVHRGGRSVAVEDSFLHRAPTPGLRNTSDMFPESSLQASTPKQFPSIRVHEPDRMNLQHPTPPVPAAPFPSPDKKGLQAADVSPLKLFGPYDTFTNQMLNTRISQFEDSNSPPSSERILDEQKTSVDALRHMIKPTPRSPSGADGTAPTVEGPHHQAARSVSQFGAGQLDGYAFNDDFTRLSVDSGEGSVLHHSALLNPLSNISLPPANNIVIGKRRPKPESTSSTQGTTASREFAGRPMKVLATPHQGDLALEIKRHRTSPTKNPTPKRRRTLHQSDIAFGVDKDLLLEAPHDSKQLHLVVEKKRKDVSAGNKQRTSDANILASRQLLRPRTPTPSRGSSLRREVHLSPDSFLEQEIAKLPRKAPGHAPLPNPSADLERKPSIRTEDFQNAAHRIMAAIRGKPGLQSGLASLEESDEEFNRQFGDYTVDDGSVQESTRERLSRPPSREGKPIPTAAKRQEDPKLVNHLKKYEEHSDMGDIIAASLRSLGVSKEDIKAVQALELNSHSSKSEKSEIGMLDDSVIVSDPANLRILGNSHRYENSTAAEQAERFRDRFPSNGSGSESGFSTVRTGSSRNSDTRRTIAPESVSHLIPDQVGEMILDKERNVWIRIPQTTRIQSGTTSTSETSEDDVFADIPDLTVDETKELQNLRLRMAQQGAAGARASETDNSVKSQAKTNQNGTLKSILVKDLGDRQNKPDSPRSPSRLMKRFVEADDEDVEKEITIHDDRLDDSSPKRRREVNFSSPVSIVIQDMPAIGSSEEQEASNFEPVPIHLPPSTGRPGRRKVSSQSNTARNTSRPRSSSSAPPRRVSVQGEPFVPRAVSVIEEQDEDNQGSKVNIRKELSVVGEQGLAGHKPTQFGSRQTSLSILVSTPGRPQPQPRPENAEIIGHYVGDFSLTPLSDFTAHQERSYALEVSYVLGDHNLVTGDGSQPHMSQAVRQLVDKIAEVEAFEPFWEDMKELQLRDKKLGSLHMLDRFCGRLVRIDASQNSLRTLDGIPSTVRELTLSHNMLTDLTAWDRLANLQYVNISNNGIKSLSCFRNLVHLRDLVADNTGLVNLDGIKYHEALLTVRARGNAIEELDFDGTSLQRLTTLDLEDNKIRKVESLHELSSLTYLSLKSNRMVDFAPKEVLPLKQLLISDNKLRSLDLAAMTRLHLVDADRNRLTTVAGLHRTKHLDSLSLREQGGSKPFDVTTLARTYEVRKLVLSGNRLGVFAPPRDFLNLQLLDLANCGLQRLPDHLGDMMPNLRVLNLNFNGLSDVTSLLGIPRLKRLFLAGNRFADLKTISKVLAEFPWLVELDLRDTFLTQGFYPTVHMVAQKSGDKHQSPINPFRLPEAEPGRDAKFCGLLDMDTRIQRRIYERKLVRACAQLQKLDGLPVNRKVRHVKDIVWKAMVERGLLLRPDGSPFDLSNVTLEDEGPSSFMTDERSPPKRKGTTRPDDSSFWRAEDSFAWGEGDEKGRV